MKKVLVILGGLVLLCVPMSVVAAEGDLQTLAPLTDKDNVVINKDVKIKQNYVINKLLEK